MTGEGPTPDKGIAGPEDSAPAAPGEVRGFKICPACHTRNDPLYSYCYRCGVRLPEEATTDAVRAYRPGGFWIRLVAYLIDGLLLGVVATTISMPVSGWLTVDYMDTASRLDMLLGWRYILVSLAVEGVYWTVAIGAWGRTIGKAMLGLKVVRKDGSRVSYMLAFFRFLAMLLSGMAFCLGYFVIVLNPEKRALHDFICGTRVIRD